MKNRTLIIKIILLFLFTSSIMKGQAVKFEISIPLMSHKVTNIDVLKSNINKSYVNDYYIPNFRFTAKYKRFISGIEYYKHSRQSHQYVKNELSEISISTNINSISLLLGLEILNQNSVKISGGIGITYHHPVLVIYPFKIQSVFAGSEYSETNNFGALFWLSLSKSIYNKFNIGLNLRYNPMFKSFYDKTPKRGDSLGYDRLNYFVSQLSIGYQF